MQASPSKARAQALASHSWSIVSGWLARLYHPSPVPAFERNAATLQALQSLMAENIAADRVQELLFEAKVEELEAAEEEEAEERRTMGIESNHDAIAIMSLLETSLAPAATTALESLASSVVVLGRASPSTSASTRASVLGDLPSRIVNIPRQTFAQESQLSAIETLTADLQTQVTRTKRDLAAFFAERTPPTSARAQDDDPTSPTTPSSSPTQQHLRTTRTTDLSHLHNLTLQHQRETKQLTLKSTEYRSRIDALENHLAAFTRAGSNSGPSSSTDPTVLAAKQRSLAAKKKRLDALHDRIRQFHGLPPDIEVSRAEVRRAEGDLDRLRRRRDDLFEAL
ncbi:hypothetical protein Z517_12092 [Fonsecaea pedrosoi CBS 271.37]|uniref:HAUS augmin-like complex subunit 1 n=1 Tax=Fonsecaea pedrosoi CBS 271.37 TaxID=1442368 RepID=A0A0D2G3H4_9EURO|nr:uncharacterized protein Z517_12092 [Fonsecaea pedrosoi CBS 271.37]KIW75318.1 hypothetical protein Z517_12092 [Fonsecaea pedrosoi CBS 271.37]